MEDAASVIGLPRKDFLRPLNVTTLDGLNAKQHAYALSGVTERMSSTDVLETGGEMVPGLQELIGFHGFCSHVSVLLAAHGDCASSKSGTL